MKSSYLREEKGKAGFRFNFSDHAMERGYLTVTMGNTGNKIVQVNCISLKKPVTPLFSDSTSWTNERVAFTDPPIDGGDNGGGGTWDPPVDGGSFAVVTITAPSTNASYYFYSPRGTVLNKSWDVGAGVAPSGGTGGPGTPGSGTPTGAAPPEVKKVRRELNSLGANKCEANYIIDHLLDVPLMAADLFANRLAVEQNLAANNMSAGNMNGEAPENAYKHALITAINYCDIGEQHTDAIANLHEVCDGVNQNPTVAQKTMDVFNNSKGMAIAKATGCSNRNALSAAVLAAYNNGTLHKINGQPTP